MSMNLSAGMPEQRPIDSSAPEDAPATFVIGVMMPSSSSRYAAPACMGHVRAAAGQSFGGREQLGRPATLGGCMGGLVQHVEGNSCMLTLLST